MLDVKQISKAFGGIKAVDDCSLCVERGSVTGLIGRMAQEKRLYST